MASAIDAQADCAPVRPDLDPPVRRKWLHPELRSRPADPDDRVSSVVGDMRGRPVKSILCIVAAVLLVSGTAHAAADVGTVDQMIQQFQTHASGWGAALRGLALNSFYILGVIDIALTAIGWAFRGGDLGDLLSSLVSEIMFLGIFLALLQNSVSWSQDIVSSFRQGAAAAGATAVTPGDVVLAGVNIAQQVMSVSAWSHPIAFVAFMIAGIVIDICFASIALMMVAVLVESYLVIQAGVILMAFGGSRWTKDIALSAIKYAVAVGAKLMALQFLANLGTSFVRQWTTGLNANNDTPLLIVIACSVVLLGVCKIVPETFQRLVGGASLASGAPIAAAAGMVGAGAAAAVLGGAGWGAASFNAIRLAGSQMAAKEDAEKVALGSGNSTPERSRIVRAATMTGYAGANLANAVSSDVGDRLSGRMHGGRASWRVASNLAQQNAQRGGSKGS